MVKSVDPDASYVVTGSKTTSKPKDLAITISTVTERHEERTRHDFQKQESNSNMKEITSTLPLSLEEARSSRNHTGKKKKNLQHKCQQIWTLWPSSQIAQLQYDQKWD